MDLYELARAVPLKVLAAVALVACASPTSTVDQAIIGGSIDDGDPAIASVGFPSGTAVCTGTLIAPRVVLTAAHCGVKLDNYWAMAVVFGSSVDQPLTTITLTDVRVHPDYDAMTLDHDLALLFLREPAAATPVPMLDRPLAASEIGSTMRIVGFGDDGAGGDRIKRQGTVQLSSFTALELAMTAAPAQPCTGDSGGPVLLTVGSVEYLAGVVNRGDAACASGATAKRVDAYLDPFIAAYLVETSSPTQGVGHRCLANEQCQSGSCVTAADDDLIAYCSMTCARDADCPDAMECAASMCRFPLPTPGAVGAACDAAEDCVGRNECLVERGVCSRRCVADGRPDCPDGYECTRLEGIEFRCLEIPRAGCCAATGGHDAALLAFLVLAIVMRRRRSA